MSFVFLCVRGPAHYKNTQCYFSVGLPRTVCALICKFNPQQHTSIMRSSKFIQTASYCCFEKFRIKRYHWITTILEVRRILRVVSHFNLSVLANEMLSVYSLCREIDNREFKIGHYG